jgi:hypothetical protein
MGVWQLREIARQSNPQHTEEAPRAFVDRVLDLEAERRLDLRHENIGWHPFSPTAHLGEHPGGSTSASEPLAIVYDRGIRQAGAHERARDWIAAARLPPRQLLAVLIRSQKMHPRIAGNEWTLSYDQIAAQGERYAQMLGFAPEWGRGLFKNGQAIKDAVKSGRAQLLMLSRC